MSSLRGLLHDPLNCEGAVPQGTAVDGPIPAPFLAPALPKAPAPAAAPIPAADENTPLSFLIKGITALANSGRRLSAQKAQQTADEPERPGPRQSPAPGVTLSLALRGETKDSFAPKEVPFFVERQTPHLYIADLYARSRVFFTLW